MVTQINSPDQFKTAVDTESLVVAYYTAAWCPPCKAIAPVFEKLSDDQVEDYCRKVVELFSYLTDKDLFAEIYRSARSLSLRSQAAIHHHRSLFVLVNYRSSKHRHALSFFRTVSG